MGVKVGYLAVDAVAVLLEELYSLLPLLVRHEGPRHVAPEDDEARLGLGMSVYVCGDSLSWAAGGENEKGGGGGKELAGWL